MKHLLLIALLFAAASLYAGNDKPLSFCNPINIDYGWGGPAQSGSFRTAADPVIVLFKGRYYLFTTLDRGGYRSSTDLVHWQNHSFNSEVVSSVMSRDGYMAPAVTADSNYVYFINFRGEDPNKQIGVIRTADPFHGKWELCGMTRCMADPCLLFDDGKAYVYYGLGENNPTRVFQADKTFAPIPGTERIVRPGIADISTCKEGYQRGRRELFGEIEVPDSSFHFHNLPCTEGVWVTKHDGSYYLQYATPGTLSQWYCDVLLKSSLPDEGFRLEPYNPVSMKVGGFVGSAGHSCVFQDRYGNSWEVTTMWVGNHDLFERRIGLFPVTYDRQGRMRVHTVLGDYPMPMPNRKFTDADIMTTGWMLQSFRKACHASSSMESHPASNAVDENSHTWWAAATGNPGEYFAVDFGKEVEVDAVQVNFADEGKATGEDYHAYRVFYSSDWHEWKLLIDKSYNRQSVPHDYVALKQRVRAKALKIENEHTPKGQKFALLDFRVFGKGKGRKPVSVNSLRASRNKGDRRMAHLSWSPSANANGYMVRFGYQPDFLNQCIQINDSGKTDLNIHILISDQDYYYRIDSFNENGITKGTLVSDKASR